MKTELELGDLVILNGRRGFIADFGVMIQSETTEQTVVVPLSDFDANIVDVQVDDGRYCYQVAIANGTDTDLD